MTKEILDALRLAKRAINELSAAIPNDDALADLVSQLQTAEDAEAAIDKILEVENCNIDD
jgi:hypothetical protein